MALTDADTRRTLLRHALATLAYRASKSVRNAPPGFAGFRAAPGTRSAVEIVAHMGDLFDWALHLCHGNHIYKESRPQAWDAEVERFFATLGAFEEYLVTDKPLGRSEELLFQGPVADALTHVGQITMMRRLADSPVRGESYLRAEIVTGRVTLAQPASQVEFD